ncbi:MAG: hypothetical protein ACI8RD_004646 [Bacillariaceae sp.]|jgi:hypothetical protein
MWVILIFVTLDRKTSFCITTQASFSWKTMTRYHIKQEVKNFRLVFGIFLCDRSSYQGGRKGQVHDPLLHIALSLNLCEAVFFVKIEMKSETMVLAEDETSYRNLLIL